MSNIQLTDISIYPIKSARGIQLSSSQVTPIGLSNDRMFVLIDNDNIFISQRKHPQMALISTQISSEVVKVSAPGFEDLSFSLNMPSSNSTIIKIWSDDCFGFIAENKINQWFSEYLKLDVRLVAYDKNQLRPTDPRYSSPGDHVSYADGFPLLLISEASLEDLNSRLKTPVTMESFRPNIVVNNTGAFEEDSWNRFIIGDVEFEAVKLCSRCILTTVDPKTGKKREDKEPLKTLSGYRRIDNGVMFGMNLIPRSQGSIKVGDKLRLL